MIMELQGKIGYTIPNPSRVIEFQGNVREFPNLTSKTYLVAEELLSASKSNSIGSDLEVPLMLSRPINGCKLIWTA